MNNVQMPQKPALFANSATQTHILSFQIPERAHGKKPYSIYQWLNKLGAQGGDTQGKSPGKGLEIQKLLNIVQSDLSQFHIFYPWNLHKIRGKPELHYP